jgi:hypothetical protein
LNKGLVNRANLIIIFLYILLCPNAIFAIEFEIWINGQVDLNGYFAEQGVDFKDELFYTSNTTLELGSIRVFDQHWEELQRSGDWLEHIGDITVSMGRIYAPVCDPDNCIIREFLLLDNGLLSGETMDHDISDLGFALAGLDYHDYSLYGVEYSESGTAYIVKFDLNANYITKYEISSLYANGMEIKRYGEEDYIFVSRGDRGELAYIDIYKLSSLSESVLNKPIWWHSFPTNYPFFPGHAEGLTIQGNQIWLAQGEYVYIGTISISYTITPSAGPNGSIDPESDVKVDENEYITFNAIPDSKYEVDQWKIKGVVVQNGGNTYTISGVQCDLNISVSFKQQAFSESETKTLYPTDDIIVKNQSGTKSSSNSSSIVLTQNSSNDWWYGLIKFDLTQIPNGSIINSATFKLNSYLVDSGFNEAVITPCGISWSERTTNWQGHPNYQGDFTLWCYNNSQKWWEWTDSSGSFAFRDSVQNWLNNPANNYGFYILPDNSGYEALFQSSEYNISSDRPKLSVNYTLPDSSDLIITKLYPDPAPESDRFIIGQNITWNVTVKNNNGGKANPSSVGYYLGKSSMDLSNLINKDSIDSLDEGDSGSAKDSYVFIASDAGQRYLICKSDCEENIEESNEDNNIRVYGPFNVIPPIITTPIISPNGGTFLGSTQIEISCPQASANIRYTTNGLDPTSNSTLYTEAFTISNSCTIKARGFEDEYTDSDIALSVFTITPDETPELSIAQDIISVNANIETIQISVDNIGSGTMPWSATITDGKDWLSISSGSDGTDKGIIVATLSANSSGSPRTGTIRINAAGASESPKDITITQLGINTVDSDGDGVEDGVDLCPNEFGDDKDGCSIHSDPDQDGDGFSILFDCDDENPSVHPGATEVCGDGIDQNCDGSDLVCPPNSTWYRDMDGDGYGNPDDSTLADSQPSGYVSDNSDCDDINPGIHPGGTEICGDAIDQDCNGSDLTCTNIVTIQTFKGQVKLESPFGTTMSNFKSTDEPSATDLPEDIDLIYGMLEFKINDVIPGDSTTVTISLPTGASPNTYYKYGPTPDNHLFHWYEFLYDGETGAEINNNIITLHFVDGKRGDNDLNNKNGVISDPGGPAIKLQSPKNEDSGGGCFLSAITN